MEKSHGGTGLKKITLLKPRLRVRVHCGVRSLTPFFEFFSYMDKFVFCFCATHCCCPKRGGIHSYPTREDLIFYALCLHQSWNKSGSGEIGQIYLKKNGRNPPRGHGARDQPRILAPPNKLQQQQRGNATCLVGPNPRTHSLSLTRMAHDAQKRQRGGPTPRRCRHATTP
jgi:hypothetical protein